MAVNVESLQKQLMDKIDKENLVEVEKVERYISLVSSFNRMSKTIEEEGETLVTENGAQRFTKAHPLISERNKINTALLAIERSFEFETKKGGYDINDLF
ncbi:P27 family phage terminase small subunit [Solibacillus sp. FSL W8-0474]|uniref:P27 family phage terminase small subunit n=1 Tax=Solibacillus sp. FSL W8-0474 TaxID=2975336 RepID=UPI0030F9D857